MSTLLVTPFAPYRDGIAAYALQELRRLRESGEEVEVCSPQPSAARWHLPLGGPAGMWKLAALAKGHDRVLMQFGPELAFGRCRSAGDRVAVWAALAALARRRPLELRLHEIEYDPLDQNPMERFAARVALAQADRITVHTEAERSALDQRTGLGQRIELVDHGRDFTPAVAVGRSQARRRLGLSEYGYVFVAIGFLQHHKGFDRAVDAIDRLHGDAHLHIVGSARVDHPEIASYVAALRGRCAQVANATLHERYVSDIEFDLWLQAADTVVLPYREIWSSGVLERARLFGTQILASELPQLQQQAPPDARFFRDTDELAMAMDKLRSEAQLRGEQLGDPRLASGWGAVEPRPPGTEPGPSSASVVIEQAWSVDPDDPDRGSIQRQIADRARAEVMATSTLAADGDHDAGGRPTAVEALIAIGPLDRPEPTSARPGVAPVKRFVDRLTAWRVDPLAHRLEDLHRATTEAVARLEADSARAVADPAPPVGPDGAESQGADRAG